MRRAALQGLRLAGTIVQALTEHARVSAHSAMTLPELAEWLHRWCVVCLRRLGAEYSFYGRPPEGSLLIANHLSYLDVIVLSAIAPCVFVAKQEVEDWPIFGRMARLSGTIFIDRERRTDVQRVTEKIAQAARSGTMVVLFPEGGSSSGRTVLPFYSSLLQPAVELELPITPAHLSYTLDDGNPETDNWLLGRYDPRASSVETPRQARRALYRALWECSEVHQPQRSRRKDALRSVGARGGKC